MVTTFIPEMNGSDVIEDSIIAVMNSSLENNNNSDKFQENISSSTPFYDYDYESFTEYIEYSVAEFINNYYLYFVCVIGIPGNIACIITLTFMGGKLSSAMYMTTLAIADLIAIGLKLAYFLLTKYDIRLGDSVCRLMFMFGTVSQMYSNWILVVMTTERFIAIWFPLKVKKLCSKWRSISILIVLFILFILVNLQFIFTFEEVKDPFLSWDCRPKEQYRKFIQTVWYWIDGALYAVLPIIIILVLNSLIIYAVRKSNRALTNLTNRRKNSKDKLTQQKQITLMLLAVSLTFVLLVMPNCIFFVARQYWTWKETQLGIAQYYLVYQIVFLLSDLNHAVNFYLYCLSGRKFRQKFINVLCFKRNAQLFRAPSVNSVGIPGNAMTSHSSTIATVSTPASSPMRQLT
ncbi:hypothetical protein ACF0H5_011546 [Mactra antiquata]